MGGVPAFWAASSSTVLILGISGIRGIVRICPGFLEVPGSTFYSPSGSRLIWAHATPEKASKATRRIAVVNRVMIPPLNRDYLI
jgi:hypothetical protein